MSKKVSKPEANFAAQSQTEGDEQPKPEMNPDDLQQDASQESTSAGEPSLNPPEAGIFAEGDMQATAWFNSKKVTGVWASNNNKNAYLHIHGVGWVKLNDANADSVHAMYLMGCVARQENRNVNYRKENDNKIHEIYVW
ncbi:hypothetical protein [Tunicatimonas pelagia]|uniref:hypothetical protein n=1 Tax=Tunicatimonas pelagia TaxID=931531 RepID=UPI00266634EF|nr:hypothetical protein [Tunicatimonas pelagia]WKN45012.1 hypothetical protein P0M28_08550 [Tunicatimonas pelagia]